MIYECRITRSCIYWDDDKRETFDFAIEAESLNDAKLKLYKEVISLEVRSASKLVQDMLIKIDGKFTPIILNDIKNIMDKVKEIEE